MRMHTNGFAICSIDRELAEQRMSIGADITLDLLWPRLLHPLIAVYVCAINHDLLRLFQEAGKSC